jgi:hypothetical protein
MRWARLLLSREIDVTDLQVLRMWDYMFACCLSTPSAVLDSLDPLSMELLPHASGMHDAVLAAHSRYGPSNALLTALGNFMLAMLLHVIIF